MTKQIIDATDNLPLVSFIIPTYNADKYLFRCLQSINNQAYPREKIEVIIADGRSNDDTLMIANQFGYTIVDNIDRDADNGKYLAIQKSEGEYLIFLDADNIIVGNDWLIDFIKILKQDSSLLGAESNYLINNDFSSLNTYANLLVIVDPLARCLSSKPLKIDNLVFDNIKYQIKHYDKSHIPVAGANGFIWKREFAVDNLDHKYRKFAETSILAKISGNQAIKYINIPNYGVYHYYSDTLSDYIKKRVKIGNKYLERRGRQVTWVEQVGIVRFILASIYLASVIGPSFEAIYMSIRTKKIQWLWHPIISFITIAIYFKLFISKII